MIAVDVGNTNVSFVWFRGERIVKKYSLPTANISLKAAGKVLSGYSREIILVCSVVPSVNKIFRKLKNKVYIVGEDLKVPIKSYYNPKQIGMDRLVGAYAARALVPKARLILDFGTAITLDFLSSRGQYLGGLILPGVGSTLKVLSRCALLPPKIEFGKPRTRIPRTTRESINKGLSEGFSAMANSLVKTYQKKLKLSSTERVIITGGEAAVVLPALNFPYYYEPFLVAKGLLRLSRTRAL